MSGYSNQENAQQNENKDNKNKVSEEDSKKNALSFKDWKNLKTQSKPSDKTTNNESKGNNNTGNSGRDVRNNFGNNYMGDKGPNYQRMPNFFPGNNYTPAFMPPNNFTNFNGNGFNNNFGPAGNNNFGPLNNGLNFNNFDGPNNMNFKNRNNFNNSFNHSNRPNNFGAGRNRFNGPSKGNNIELPNEFFASDGMYRQKDFMQQPLHNYNPFRNDAEANHLLKDYDRTRYTKEGKRKKKLYKNAAEANKTNDQEGVMKLSSEPKVYIPNPKAKIDGKPFIPKPKVPEENYEISKEEKKRQWKEYRQAMKPFKNRDFYNAKRVVQRLGKKAPSELNDKEIIRLANARQIVTQHKAHLSAKYANYVKDENSSELGELYVLKKQPLKQSDCGQQKEFENGGNFGFSDSSNSFEPCRKILGGFTGFKEFVSGSLFDSMAQNSGV